MLFPTKQISYGDVRILIKDPSKEDTKTARGYRALQLGTNRTAAQTIDVEINPPISPSVTCNDGQKSFYEGVLCAQEADEMYDFQDDTDEEYEQRMQTYNPALGGNNLMEKLYDVDQ